MPQNEPITGKIFFLQKIEEMEKENVQFIGFKVDTMCFLWPNVLDSDVLNGFQRFELQAYGNKWMHIYCR